MLNRNKVDLLLDIVELGEIIHALTMLKDELVEISQREHITSEDIDEVKKIDIRGGYLLRDKKGEPFVYFQKYKGEEGDLG